MRQTMRKLILVLLLFISYSAWADKHYGTKWVWVAGTIEGDAYYIDPATIRKEGTLRKYWKLADLKAPNKNGDMSWRVREELDCKKERYRITSLTTFSDSMIKGRITGNYNIPNDEWSDIAPGTLDDYVMKYVCNR